MSLNETLFISSEDDLDFISQFNTDKLVIIAPNLDSKKRLVDSLALKLGTVPDTLVLRLSEFFTTLVQNLQPEIEFLDKKLFQNFLRQEFDRLGLPNSDLYMIEKSVEYISVYAPILAQQKYRSIFEEYLAEDEIFKNIYTEMYPMMTKVWDMVLSSPYMINQWSLGWLYKNVEKLSQQDIDIVIYKPNSLKKIELDFFEEMGHHWNVNLLRNNISIDSNINSDPSIDANFANTRNDTGSTDHFHWHKVTTALDEIELLGELIFKESTNFEKIKIVIPRKKVEYVKCLELFLSFYFDLESDKEEGTDKINFHTLRVFTEDVLKTFRIKKNESESTDVQNVLEGFKNRFKSNDEFMKHTSLVFDPSQIKHDLLINEKLDSHTEEGLTGLNSYFQTEDISLGNKINYHQFLIKVEKSFTDSKIEKPNTENLKSMVFDWTSSLISKIPVFIELSIENWFLYLQALIQNKTELELTRTKLPIQFFEDVEFRSDYKYFILGCSQQNYESSNYAYLSNLEIDKLKSDLGFNFESKEFSEQFYDDFINLTKFESRPEIHFISSLYSIQSDKENDAKFLNQLYQDKHCTVVDHRDRKILKFETAGKLNVSDINISKQSYKNFTRDYQSASSVQKYINCPYTYYCEYVLGVKHLEDLDLEPSGMIRGKVFHNVLEKFVDDSSINENKITQFIKLDLSKTYSHWADTDIIEEQMRASSSKVADYILFDIKLKNEQQRVTRFRELDSSCYFNEKNGIFSKKRMSENDIKFIGKIDRIDVIDEKIYILDYKLSDGKSLNDWKKNYLVQMPIYGLMFIDGVLPLQGELSQLSYIAINQSFKFKNGLSIKYKDSKFNLGMFLNKSNSQPDPEALKKELNRFRELLKASVQLIGDANFSPAPIEQEYCTKCDWKDTCHASHLY